MDQSSSMWDKLDEQQLVEAAKRHADAVSALYRRHYATIHRYIARRVTTTHDVQDIVSEVFLTMVRELPRYRWTGAPFQAWLFRIANTQISRWVRKRKWFRFWAPFEDQVSVSSSEVDEADLIQQLRKCLLQLPSHYQDTLAMFYLEDLSIKSIAEVLTVEEGTIKARLSRGRLLLKTHLESSAQTEVNHERRTARSMLEPTQKEVS